MYGRFGRLLLAVLFSLTLARDASAETAAETARKWGLIGAWSLDCSLPPDRNKGTVLAYEIAPDGKLVHRRNFGDGTDESPVLSAEISRNGMLNLRIFFPSLKQTREFGMMMQPDGSIRAIYNRDEKHQYSIRDGKFTGSGNPTPSQHKCSGAQAACKKNGVYALASAPALPCLATGRTRCCNASVGADAALLNSRSEFSSGSLGTFP